MIKPVYNKFWVEFILFFISFSLKIHFKRMVFKGEFKNNGKPVLMIANHFSWWDGFFQSFLNKKVFKRRLYFMMLESELRKRMLLRKAGAYSVARRTRSVIESLNYSVDLLKNSNNMVLIFPQGKIESMHVPEIRFEKGTEYILKRSQSGCQIIFNVNLIDYQSDKKPVVCVYYKCFDTEGTDYDQIRKAFQEFYDTCKLEQAKQ